MLTFPLRYPRRRDNGRRRASAEPPAPPLVEVLVTSVVALPDGSVVMTFSAPVTLTAGPIGESIWLEDDGGRGGWADEMEQPGGAGTDAIIMRTDGVMLASNSTWTILADPANLQVAAGSIIVVPQNGTVE